MKRYLIAIALFAIAAIYPVASMVKEAKPANAAVYCAPWQNWWCYEHYLVCGPYKAYYDNGEFQFWTDRCGVYL